jgi:tRNA nucleotidyltransferase/poly(A) polymerase
MFFDPLEKNVIDYVNGQGDLKSKLIRTIGSSAERFGEDYLRMLRAIRFSAQLDFQIERKTWIAISEKAENITKISGERIAMELEGLLASVNRGAGAKCLVDSGLAKAIFPNVSVKEFNFGIEVLGRLPKWIDFALGLAALFSACDTDFVIKKCALLKLSRNRNKQIKFLLGHRGKLLVDLTLAELKMILAEPYFNDLYELQKAIQRAKGESEKALKALKRRINELGDVELKPEALLNGHELMALGAVSGPDLGQLAQEMYIAQLEGAITNKPQAEQWVTKWLKKHKSGRK